MCCGKSLGLNAPVARISPFSAVLIARFFHPRCSDYDHAINKPFVHRMEISVLGRVTLFDQKRMFKNLELGGAEKQCRFE
jgi:hypothetical protein